MPSHALPHQTHYVIATLKHPVAWAIDGTETWLLNPARRYVFNADMVRDLSEHVDTLSDLRSGSKYKPLKLGENILGKRVLVDRYRHRGIGDLLFLTGPLAWLQHSTGGNVTADLYALAERGCVFNDNPAVSGRAALNGPIHYDDFDNYAAQWMVEQATEFDEQPDQLNVYDALYRTMDVDPGTVDPKFKRPFASLNSADVRGLDAYYWQIHRDFQLDFRSTPYYTVAPLSHASLRTVPYTTWLEVIEKLARKAPVVVLGSPREGLTPAAGISYAEFAAELDKMRAAGAPLVDSCGKTPLRLTMAIVSRSKALACLDSGLLYVAQAFHTPAVSVWGTHDPRTRIGYDKAYMDLAVFDKRRCPHAPCYAYSRFPTHKCPSGENQSVCEVLKVPASEILEKISSV